jgi:ubiquinone biosynthesis protein Coq4
MMKTTTTSPVDVADLHPVVRWTRALRALARVMVNPEETEQVLVFSNLANAGGRRDERLGFFYDDPRGARLFAEKRTIDSTTVDLDAFEQLPEGTLGHAYAKFMMAHDLTPNVFDGPPEDVRDERAAYVIQRMRQTHDLWHVVTHCETDPAGEIALQAFTFAQVKAPSSAILAAVGTLRSLRHTREVLRDAHALYRRGLAAQPLVLFPWEDYWATPLTEVRRMLGLPESPRLTGGYTAELLQRAAA